MQHICTHHPGMDMNRSKPKWTTLNWTAQNKHSHGLSYIRNDSISSTYNPIQFWWCTELYPFVSFLFNFPFLCTIFSCFFALFAFLALCISLSIILSVGRSPLAYSLHSSQHLFSFYRNFPVYIDLLVQFR